MVTAKGPLKATLKAVFWDARKVMNCVMKLDFIKDSWRFGSSWL